VLSRRIKCAASATALRLLGAERRNRRLLYDGRRGLRMAMFHDTPPESMDRFERLVDWCRERFEIVGPERVEAMFAGRRVQGARDLMHITFDDGMQSNFAAAERLA